MASAAPISEHEAALYDRQIRLWGLDAQQRLRSTSVLIIGVKGLSAEIAKNIVLAGAGSVTIVDENKVTVPDLGANFFLREEDVGKPRAQAILPRVHALNPLVNVKVSDKDYLLPANPITEYNVVVAVDLALHQAVRVEASGIPFVLANSFGFYSTAFIDADKHRYHEMRQEIAPPASTGANSKKRSAPESEEKKEVRVDGVVSAPSLKTALALAWNDSQLERVHPLFFALQGAADVLAHMKKVREQKLASTKAKLKTFDDAFLEKFARNSRAEISAVCAIVGGIIGQEVIKLVTAKDEPLRNFMFYDGWTDQGLTAVIPEKATVAPVAAPVVLLELDDD